MIKGPHTEQSRWKVRTNTGMSSAPRTLVLVMCKNYDSEVQFPSFPERGNCNLQSGCMAPSCVPGDSSCTKEACHPPLATHTLIRGKARLGHFQKQHLLTVCVALFLRLELEPDSNNGKPKPLTGPQPQSTKAASVSSTNLPKGKGCCENQRAQWMTELCSWDTPPTVSFLSFRTSYFQCQRPRQGEH